MAINPKIKQKAEDIRKKIFGAEVRESLASGLEGMSEDVESIKGRQGNVENQFQDVLDETTGKDVINGPEVIAARNGEANLKTRLDKEKQEVTAQLQQTEQELSSQLADKANIADLPSSAYTFKGSTTFAALPTTGNTLGDVYYTTDNLVNYAWTGTVWTPIGNGSFSDGSVVNSKLAYWSVSKSKLDADLKSDIYNTATKDVVITWTSGYIDNATGVLITNDFYTNWFSQLIEFNVGDTIAFDFAKGTSRIYKYTPEGAYIKNQVITETLIVTEKMYARLFCAYASKNAYLTAITPITDIFNDFKEALPVEKYMLPIPKIYAVQNKPINLYFKNVCYKNPEEIIIENGNTAYVPPFLRRSVFWNSSFAQTWVDLKINVRDKSYNLLQAYAGKQIIASENARTGESDTVLVIGDSFIDNGYITQQLVDVFATDVMDITLIGTRGSGANKHEGRSGWSSYDYLSTASYNGSANAFLNGASFDFANYLTANALATPTIVLIELGINDLWRPMNGTTTTANLQAIIDNIKLHDPTIKIGVALVPPPYLGSGENGRMDKEHYRRLALNESLISYFGSMTGVYLIPINTALDTEYGFTLATKKANTYSDTMISYATDTTHPAIAGYKQIADCYYAFIKNKTNLLS